ncbi:hypothetical protein AX17_005517 [Amanita inopinata Kibby_2008]|nr:hypothetical protein AX17_005517 [Amanita inopinata Kibby_2008]
MSLPHVSSEQSPRSRKRSPSPSADSRHRPSKLARTSSVTSSASMSSLKRTDTLISLSSLCAPPSITPPPPVPLPPVITSTTAVPPHTPSSSASSGPSASSSGSQAIPYTRTLHYYKEQRERRKALIQSGNPDSDPLFLLIANSFLAQPQSQQQEQQSPPQQQPSIFFPPSTASPSRGIRITCNARFRSPVPQASRRPKQRSSVPRFRPSFQRIPSPLAPRPYTSSTRYNMQLGATPDNCQLLPRSRPEPDLYRIAIKANMRRSKEGQQLLSLGPRLTRKLVDATRELEKIVATENGLVISSHLSQQPLRPTLRPLRPLVRTESIADLSPFIRPANSGARDVRMASPDTEKSWNTSSGDWDMVIAL